MWVFNHFVYKSLGLTSTNKVSILSLHYKTDLEQGYRVNYLMLDEIIEFDFL